LFLNKFFKSVKTQIKNKISITQNLDFPEGIIGLLKDKTDKGVDFLCKKFRWV